MGAIADAITGGINRIIDFLTGILNSIYSAIVSIVDYLNPLSENFILKIAFIPEERYLQGKIDELIAKTEDSVGLLSQLRDSFYRIAGYAREDGPWEGVKVGISSYGVGYIGEVTVVDPSFVNYVSWQVKFWLKGIIWFMVLFWLIRRIAGFWGRGE